MRHLGRIYMLFQLFLRWFWAVVFEVVLRGIPADSEAASEVACEGGLCIAYIVKSVVSAGCTKLEKSR